jgi:hypothetical protein
MSLLLSRQLGQGFVAGWIPAWKGVYQTECVEVPPHPSFRVHYSGGISRQTWAPHLRFADLNVHLDEPPLREAQYRLGL